MSGVPAKRKATAPKARPKLGAGSRTLTVRPAISKAKPKGQQPFIVSNLRGPGTVELRDALEQYGPAQGAKKLMDREAISAQWSIETGVYGVWRCHTRPIEKPSPANPHALDFCSRIGPTTRCFCGHLFQDHDMKPTAKRQSTKCHLCHCPRCEFVPTRPEEIGDHWLPRRKDFNVTTWRVKCRCGHTHEQHDPGFGHHCNACGCSQWTGMYECMNCDRPAADHETEWETREERRAMGYPTPLSLIIRQGLKLSSFIQIPPNGRKQDSVPTINQSLDKDAIFVHLPISRTWC
ncbi:putative FAM221B-like protein [Blattamonas nauphoetae]|uniref:FAM221B-like protein n=1 Tax=Blattamonas nauphoetae TaxID=2049346 RepID=A0ABQ9YLV7_9EUKA|nr:putative FAM221B-like protein [Blattamonas nauphoetae]